MNETNEHRGHGRARALRLTIAGLSLAAVIAVSLWESQERTSPGELHSSHAALSELRGKHGCVECHGGILTSMADSCLECHDPIAAQLDAKSGIHGRLAPETAKTCEVCHVEHTGGTVALVTAHSFEAAGTPVIADYRHEEVAQFALAERHEELDCDQCHVNAHAEQLPMGSSRFLGLSQACTACHEDAHQGSYGPDCASCHGQAHDFKDAPLFTHEESFPLAGSHSGLECAQCHEPGTEHGVATLLATPFESRDCVDCHDSPHSSEFVAQIASARQVPESASCETCHAPDRLSFSGADATMTAELHAAAGFRLDPPHNSQTCAECHPGFGENHPTSVVAVEAHFETAFPGRAEKDCRACHEDPHNGEFDRGFSRGDCLACHAEAHFTPSRFDASFHSKTGYALTGRHASVSCHECHTNADTGKTNKLGHFLPISKSCAECHSDAHRGRLLNATKTSATQDCAQCHTTESFSTAAWTAADHARWTGFALDGAHSRADCMACHLPAGKPSKEGRTFGFAETNCSACHADPHGGQFSEAGVIDCTRCHSGFESWSSLQFDHQRDTRFALDEHHAKLACAECHRPVEIGRGRTITKYKPLGTQCADCHGFQGVKGASG